MIVIIRASALRDFAQALQCVWDLSVDAAILMKNVTNQMTDVKRRMARRAVQEANVSEDIACIVYVGLQAHIAVTVIVIPVKVTIAVTLIVILKMEMLTIVTGKAIARMESMIVIAILNALLD